MKTRYDVDGIPVRCEIKGSLTPHEWAQQNPATPQTGHDIPDVFTEQWDREKARNADLDIDCVPPDLMDVAWYWQCSHGHTWREPIGIRTRTPREPWRDIIGNTEQCPQCTLDAYSATYALCGHTSPDLIDTSYRRHIVPSRCPACSHYEPTGADPNEVPPGRYAQYETLRRTISKGAVNKKREWSPTPDIPPLIGWGEPGPPADPFDSLDYREPQYQVNRAINYLTKLGYPVRRASITLPELTALPIDPTATWVAQPHLVCDDNIIIELDTPRWFGGDPMNTGANFPAETLYYDDCYRAAGYTVIRARFSKLKPVPGAYNIFREKGLSNEVFDLIAEAIDAIRKGKPVTDVHATPPAPKKPLRPVSISTFRRVPRKNGDADATHISNARAFVYTHSDGKKRRFRLMCSGRYLYVEAKCVEGKIDSGIPAAGPRPAYVFVMPIYYYHDDKEKTQEYLKRRIPSFFPAFKKKRKIWSEFPFDGPVARIETPASGETLKPQQVAKIISYSSPVENVLQETQLHVETPTPVASWHEDIAKDHSESSVALFDHDGQWLGTVDLTDVAVEQGFRIRDVAVTETGVTLHLVGPELGEVSS